MATMVSRALRRGCPSCGTPAFTSWFTMRESCGGCGLAFEREPGYWVGAVTINTAVTFISFVTLFAALTFLNWPDVPWGLVMSVTVAVNVILPVVLYPISKTMWSALEMSWHPLEPQEIADAAARMEPH